MKQKNRVEELYDTHVHKDAMIWDELTPLLKAMGIEGHLERIDALTRLIHDNNYMLITLCGKAAECERRTRKENGNH